MLQLLFAMLFLACGDKESDSAQEEVQDSATEEAEDTATEETE
tara:strand:+ start:800 stop:928 length:129 start_codon:yes stop_codon:yes gene_type:complete